MVKKRVSSTNILAKESIVSAMLQLIKEKPLSSINISELCKKAEVSRMTFYRNYDSKEDIFIKHLSEIFEDYKRDENETDSAGIYCDKKHLNHYFDYLDRHRNFLDGLILCGFDVIFLDMMSSYIIEKWSNVENKYVLTAFAGSLYNMFHLWSKSNYSENRAQLINTLQNLYS